jgi:hypothetical protein
MGIQVEGVLSYALYIPDTQRVEGRAGCRKPLSVWLSPGAKSIEAAVEVGSCSPAHQDE